MLQMIIFGILYNMMCVNLCKYIFNLKMKSSNGIIRTAYLYVSQHFPLILAVFTILVKNNEHFSLTLAVFTIQVIFFTDKFIFV